MILSASAGVHVAQLPRRSFPAYTADSGSWAGRAGSKSGSYVQAAVSSTYSIGTPNLRIGFMAGKVIFPEPTRASLPRPYTPGTIRKSRTTPPSSAASAALYPGLSCTATACSTESNSISTVRSS